MGFALRAKEALRAATAPCTGAGLGHSASREAPGRRFGLSG